MKEEEGEGDGDNGEVEGRRRRSGGRPAGRRGPGVAHMVAIFYKRVVNLRKINSNWENKRNYHLCTVIGDLQIRKVVEDLYVFLRLWSGDGFETKVRVFSKYPRTHP